MSNSQTTGTGTFTRTYLSKFLMAFTAVLVLLELTFTIFKIPNRPIDLSFDLMLTGTLLVLAVTVPKLFVSVWRSEMKGMSVMHILPTGVAAYVAFVKFSYFSGFLLMKIVKLFSSGGVG